ncbi:MAG: hypothetical protein DCF22_26120 [Leptolyngbya sp.]|nr:MAG: hypothetical protein DCF22_26120 [Leptolyngbya sp.]
MITELTPEQRSLVLNCWKKWKSIALSTDKLQHEQAANTIKSAYQLMGFEEPSILFCNSPLQVLQQFGDPPSSTPPCNLFAVASGMHEQLRKQVTPLLWTRLWRRQSYVLGAKLSFSLHTSIIAALEAQLKCPLIVETQEQIRAIAKAAGDVAILDFLTATLGCNHDFAQQWHTLLALIENCPWHFAFEDVCIVYDRPTKILPNSDGCLQIGEEPAMCRESLSVEWQR